jgi:hypothetical protein
MATFELNGQSYSTDAETLAVLRSVAPSAKASGDSSAVIAIVELGLRTGRIVRDICVVCDGGPANFCACTC